MNQSRVKINRRKIIKPEIQSLEHLLRSEHSFKKIFIESQTAYKSQRLQKVRKKKQAA